MKKIKSFNVQLWVGLREQYTDKIHTIEEVYKECDAWCLQGDCVTITETVFRYKNGFEPGVVIGWINYPRFPKLQKDITGKALELGYRLKSKFNQYRVTVTTPKTSIMI